MFHVCPLCNGLVSLELQCPNCLNPAVDCGKRDDYVEPYAPYAESGEVISSTDDKTLPSQYRGKGSSQKQCLHMMYCHVCHTSLLLDGYKIADS